MSGNKRANARGKRPPPTPPERQPKSSVAKPAMKSGDYPFPFYGEGLAEYAESCDLQVWFVREPDLVERKAIMKHRPRVLKSVDWDGPAMSLGNGDQHANLAIREAYPPMGNGAWASTRQIKAFEADLVTWLVKTHATSPIAFVARREDREAGGTQLGDWHRWSMARIADHHTRVDAEPATVVGLRSWALAVPLQLQKLDPTMPIPTEYDEWLERWYARS